MRKKIPWWFNLLSFVLLFTTVTVSSWAAATFFSDWIIEYQLALVIFSFVIVVAVLWIVARIFFHNCDDKCRDFYDINKIRFHNKKR